MEKEVRYIKADRPIDKLFTAIVALFGIRSALIAAAEGNGFSKIDCDHLATTMMVVLVFLDDVSDEFDLLFRGKEIIDAPDD